MIRCTAAIGRRYNIGKYILNLHPSSRSVPFPLNSLQGVRYLSTVSSKSTSSSTNDNSKDGGNGGGKDSNTGKNDSAGGADDFLTKHGGKIAFVALSLAFYLFYSVYQGGVNRTAVEDALTEEIALEPYEVEEIRHANKLSVQVFDSLAERAFKEYPGGRIAYQTFIEFVRKEGGVRIKSGHLLDRVVCKYTAQTQQQQQQEDVIDADSLLPLSFLLVALLMTVRESAASRVGSLVRIAQHLERLSGEQSEADEASYATEPTLLVRSAELLVHELMESCQVPVEKRVAETGVKYPARTYRPKTAADFVTKARATLKPPHDRAFLTEAEFLSVLQSNEVCAWGECYRGDS